MTGRNIKKGSFTKGEEDAVSPVIGVILMVAITVILAAVIGAFVFGMGGNIAKTYVVSVTTAQTGADTIDVTFQGGPDADVVKYLNVSIGGEDINSATLDCTILPSATAGEGTFSANPSIGSSAEIKYATQITGDRDHIIVVAVFDDGAEQVVLDTYV